MGKIIKKFETENKFYNSFDNKIQCKICKYHFLELKLVTITYHYFDKHNEIYKDFLLFLETKRKKKKNIKTFAGRKTLSDDKLFSSERSAKSISNTLNQRIFRENQKRYVEKIENENKQLSEQVNIWKQKYDNCKRKLTSNTLGKENEELNKKLKNSIKEINLLKEQIKELELSNQKIKIENLNVNNNDIKNSEIVIDIDYNLEKLHSNDNDLKSIFKDEEEYNIFLNLFNESLKDY